MDWCVFVDVKYSPRSGVKTFLCGGWGIGMRGDILCWQNESMLDYLGDNCSPLFREMSLKILQIAYRRAQMWTSI